MPGAGKNDRGDFTRFIWRTTAANAGVDATVDATVEAELKSFDAAAGQLNVSDVPSEWWVTRKTLYPVVYKVFCKFKEPPPSRSDSSPQREFCTRGSAVVGNLRT